jgi:hypothetical protein
VYHHFALIDFALKDKLNFPDPFIDMKPQAAQQGILLTGRWMVS